MGTVIATRDLEVNQDGQLVPGCIQICAPEHHPEDASGGAFWACNISLDLGDYQRSRDIKGLDALQALQLALKMVPSEIRISAPFRNQTLMLWGEPLRDVDEFFSMKPLGDA